MDLEKIEKLVKNMERYCKTGQDVARLNMDREPSQKTQNNNWRFVQQELRDLRKLLGLGLPTR